MKLFYRSEFNNNKIATTYVNIATSTGILLSVNIFLLMSSCKESCSIPNVHISCRLQNVAKEQVPAGFCEEFFPDMGK